MDGVETWPNTHAFWRRTEATSLAERLIFPIDVSGMIANEPGEREAGRVVAHGPCSRQAPSGWAHTPARVEEHRRRMTAALGNTGTIGRLAATSQERGSWPPQFRAGEQGY